MGQLVTFEIKNPTSEEITVQLDVEGRNNGEWENIPVPQESIVLQLGEKKLVSYPNENIELFERPEVFEQALKMRMENSFQKMNSLWRMLALFVHFSCPLLSPYL